jgi:hypothetical protein
MVVCLQTAATLAQHCGVNKGAVSLVPGLFDGHINASVERQVRLSPPQSIQFNQFDLEIV